MTDTFTTPSKLIDGRTGPWEIVMGLEIHAQVASKAKLFSGAAIASPADLRARITVALA